MLMIPNMTATQTLTETITDLLKHGHAASDVAAKLNLSTVDTGECTAVLLPAWWADDGNQPVEFPAALDAEEAAQEYVDGGEWRVSSTTRWLDIHTWQYALGLDDEGEVTRYKIHRETHSIALQPAEEEVENV